MRYRGYYYDKETGMYYLQSRFYSPEWGRFINADAGLNYSILGKNLYAYCLNNPINLYDPYGDAAAVLPYVQQGAQTVQVYGPALWQQIYNGGSLAIGLGWDRFQNKVNDWAKPTVGQLTKVSSAPAKGDSFSYMGGGTATPPPPNNKKPTKSFSQVKKEIGSAGKGNQWHHIVEKCQIDKSGFDSFTVNNEKNLISISKNIHSQISGYYNTTTFSFTNGLSVRNWLAGQSFEVQFDFGIQVLKDFGVL